MRTRLCVGLVSPPADARFPSKLAAVGWGAGNEARRVSRGVSCSPSWALSIVSALRVLLSAVSLSSSALSPGSLSVAILSVGSLSMASLSSLSLSSSAVVGSCVVWK